MMFKSVLLVLMFFTSAGAFAGNPQNGLIEKEARLADFEKQKKKTDTAAFPRPENKVREAAEAQPSETKLNNPSPEKGSEAARPGKTPAPDPVSAAIEGPMSNKEEIKAPPESAAEEGVQSEKTGFWTHIGNFLFGKGVLSEGKVPVRWTRPHIDFVIRQYPGPEGLAEYAERYHKSDKEAALRKVSQAMPGIGDRKNLGWWEPQGTPAAAPVKEALPAAGEPLSEGEQQEAQKSSREEFNQEMAHLTGTSVSEAQRGTSQALSELEKPFVSHTLSREEGEYRSKILGMSSDKDKDKDQLLKYRMELELNRTLSPGSVKAAKEARDFHKNDIGRDLINLAGPGNYTQAQILKKVNILAQAGFYQGEAINLIYNEPINIGQEVPESVFESVSFKTPKEVQEVQASPPNGQGKQTRRPSRKAKRQERLKQQRADKKQKKQEQKEARQQQALMMQTLGTKPPSEKTSEGAAEGNTDNKESTVSPAGSTQAQDAVPVPGTVVSAAPPSSQDPLPEEGETPPPSSPALTSNGENSSETSVAVEESSVGEGRDAKEEPNLSELGVLSEESFLELSYREDNPLENTALAKAVMAGDKEAYKQALSALESAPSLGERFFMDKVIYKKTSEGMTLPGLMLDSPKEKNFFTAQMLGILLAMPISDTGGFRLHDNEKAFSQAYSSRVRRLRERAESQNNEEAYQALARLEKLISVSDSDAKTKMAEWENKISEAELRDLVSQKNFQSVRGRAELERALIGLITTGAGVALLMTPPEMSEPLVQALSRYTGIADVTFHAAEALPLVAGMGGMAVGAFSSLSGVKKCVNAFKTKRKIKKEIKRHNNRSLFL